MWIKKKEIEQLSEFVKGYSSGEELDIRVNKEGSFNILKNDIYALVNMKNEQIKAVETERDSLSDYMADISHQLKTPITSMMIMADLLEEAEPEKQTEFIHNIQVSLNKMEWLVGALLKMAKLDAHAIDFIKNGEKDNIIYMGHAAIHTDEAKVYVNDKIIELTALEYRLLLIFASNKGLLLTRQQILDKIWDSDGNFVDDNTLTVYVKRLREKLGEAIHIETVRGMGYRVD